MLEFLQPHLPPLAFHLVLNLASSLSSAIDTLLFALANPTDPEAVDALKSLVPSLLSFLALYFTIMSIYRTISTAFRLVFFIVKWVGILGALGMGFTYLMNGGNHEGFVDLIARFDKFESAAKSYANKPTEGKTGSRSIWDKFDARSREEGGGGKLWWQKDKDAPPTAPTSAFSFVMEQIGHYKWAVDALLDTTGEDAPSKSKAKSKAKSRATSKDKADQRVR